MGTEKDTPTAGVTSPNLQPRPPPRNPDKQKKAEAWMDNSFPVHEITDSY